MDEDLACESAVVDVEDARRLKAGGEGKISGA